MILAEAIKSVNWIKLDGFSPESLTSFICIKEILENSNYQLMAKINLKDNQVVKIKLIDKHQGLWVENTYELKMLQNPNLVETVAYDAITKFVELINNYQKFEKLN